MPYSKTGKGGPVVKAGVDYGNYRFTPAESLGYAGLGVFLYLTADFLLYRSLILLFLLPVFLIFWFYRIKAGLIHKRRQQLLERFQSAATAFVVALRAEIGRAHV